MDDKKNSTKDEIQLTVSDKEVSMELSLDIAMESNRDMNIIKKVLSDHMEENIIEDEKDLIEEKMIILDVKKIEDGLDKVKMLFGWEPNEIIYEIIDEYFKIENTSKIGYKKVKYKQKFIMGEVEIVISDDEQSAKIKKLYPKKLDGKKTNLVDIIRILRELNINTGVKTDNLKNYLDKVLEKYEVAENILIAAGQPPETGKDSIKSKAIFNNTNDINYKLEKGNSLKEIMNFRSLEDISAFSDLNTYYFRKGQVIAITTIPHEGKPGKNIFGEEISASMGKKLYELGENVQYKIDNNEIVYFAETKGYIEIIENHLNVVPPLWVSPDKSTAYFIKFPFALDNSFKLNIDEFENHLYDIGINHGINMQNLDNLQDILNENLKKFKTILIAEGTKSSNGDDAKIELFFNLHPLKKIRDMDFELVQSDITIEDEVNPNQLLAVKYLAKEKEPGFTIEGKVLPAHKGKDLNFKGFNNVKAVKSEDKIMFYSTIKGQVNLVGDKGVSVNQKYVIEGNVDNKTGNIDFEGDVIIEGSIMAGFTVNAGGNIIVKGSVYQRTKLTSKGNIEVQEGILGKDDIDIEAEGDVFAKYLQGANVRSGWDVKVKEYILNSIIKAHGKVMTPAEVDDVESKGSIVGGEVYSYEAVIAKIIGSEIAKNTRVFAGIDFDFETKQEDLEKAMNYCKYEIIKLSKSLRLGMQDINKLKQLLKKLPPQKRKPLIDAFKKMDYLNKIKIKVKLKIDELSNDIEKLSQNAYIIAHEQIFPNVLLQVGEEKLKTEKYILKQKFLLSNTGDKLEMVSIK